MLNYFHTRIVYIEDDEDLSEIFILCLSKLGFSNVASYRCAEDFLRAENLQSVELLICDHTLPGKMNGLKLLEFAVQDLGMKCPMFLATAFFREEFREFRDYVILKPLSMEFLENFLRFIFEPQEGQRLPIH